MRMSFIDIRYYHSPGITKLREYLMIRMQTVYISRPKVLYLKIFK